MQSCVKYFDAGVVIALNLRHLFGIQSTMIGEFRKLAMADLFMNNIFVPFEYTRQEKKEKNLESKTE